MRAGVENNTLGATQNPLLIKIPSYTSVTNWMKEDNKYFFTLIEIHYKYRKIHISIQLKFSQTEHTSVTNSQIFKK